MVSIVFILVQQTSSEDVDCYLSRTLSDILNFKLTFASCFPNACGFSCNETFLSATRAMVIMMKAVAPQLTEDNSEDIAGSAKINQRGNTKNRKQHCCFFCKKIIKSVMRHTLTIHKDENEVQHIISLPLHGRERKEALRVLRLKDDRHIMKDVPILIRRYQ